MVGHNGAEPGPDPVDELAAHRLIVGRLELLGDGLQELDIEHQELPAVLHRAGVVPVAVVSPPVEVPVDELGHFPRAFQALLDGELAVVVGTVSRRRVRSDRRENRAAEFWVESGLARRGRRRIVRRSFGDGGGD